ncbi:hypothetical protein Glove_578g33 [Diversispora epigaea]|uniref:Uncharacterized protein n=1 Tax=Diversispora epigaea TaxID=1348612 RepID=A0A397GHN0_9GLOM|nr:hypothetical protein Glove_578g33 [Diversispora epigaea]
MENSENFQWSKVCDAHNHVHVDRENLSKIGELKTSRICLMGTRFEDWDIVSKVSIDFPDKVVPCFGYHPWFAHSVELLEEKNNSLNPRDHYLSILFEPNSTNKPTTTTNTIINQNNNSSSSNQGNENENENENDLSTFITFLSPPIPFNTWYSKLESLLKLHPQALIGEIGIDKISKLKHPKTKVMTKIQTSMEHQMKLMELQLDLAAKYNRAVSLHCVQSTGQIVQLLDRKVLNNYKNKNNQNFLPPRICLHSFGGSVDTIKALTSNQPKKKKKLPTQIYFSFSIVINERYNRLPELIKAVPEDRLLIESDFHSPDGMDELMERIIKLISEIKNWSPTFTVEKTRENFLRFIDET